MKKKLIPALNNWFFDFVWGWNPVLEDFELNDGLFTYSRISEKDSNFCSVENSLNFFNFSFNEITLRDDNRDGNISKILIPVV